MTSALIHDRGRGPEIAGTRITVYTLLQSFLDPTVTEDEICRTYELTAAQVAADEKPVARVAKPSGDSSGILNLLPTKVAIAKLTHRRLCLFNT